MELVKLLILYSPQSLIPNLAEQFLSFSDPVSTPSFFYWWTSFGRSATLESLLSLNPGEITQGARISVQGTASIYFWLLEILLRHLNLIQPAPVPAHN